MQIKCQRMVDLKFTLCDQDKKLLYVLPEEVVTYQNNQIIYPKDVVVKSPNRVPVVCPIFEQCGGCDYLYMRYQHQLDIKFDHIKKLFKDALHTGRIHDIVSSEAPLHYRHKAVLSATTVLNKLRLGLYREHSKEVIPYLDCHIQDQMLNEIMKTTEATLNKYKITAYNIDTNQGIIKHILLRKSHQFDDVMMCFITNGNLLPNQKKIISEITTKHPKIRTVLQNIHKKKTHLVLLDEEKLLYGPGYIMDEIDGLLFRLSVRSFYQVNPMQMMNLYKKAIMLAQVKHTDVVLDCYSGIGTISLLLSQKAKEVIGVEINQKAHRDAVSNLKINHIKNVKFIHSDVTEYMLDHKGTLDILFMDPTREGASQTFLNAVLKLKPKRICYISCDPETQIRDVKMLQKSYRISDVMPVDMFSQTAHIENITILDLKS
jgi:23S rRNA (uracil1939-C5)-methyltransferase